MRDRVQQALDEPCATEKEQVVHDRLAQYDRLFYEGHTQACAVQQVWNGAACWCGRGGRP